MTSWFSEKKKEAQDKFGDKRFWVFVIQNPESNDLPKKFKDIDTVTWQLEKGSRGIPHLQGIVQFLYPKSFTQVKAMYPRSWWDMMRGKIHEAVAYCTKEETRVAGPWSYMPISQAVADCLAGLSGGLPLHLGAISPTPRAQIEDSVEPPAAPAAPVTECTHE